MRARSPGRPRAGNSSMRGVADRRTCRRSSPGRPGCRSPRRCRRTPRSVDRGAVRAHRPRGRLNFTAFPTRLAKTRARASASTVADSSRDVEREGDPTQLGLGLGVAARVAQHLGRVARPRSSAAPPSSARAMASRSSTRFDSRSALRRIASTGCDPASASRPSDSSSSALRAIAVSGVFRSCVIDATRSRRYWSSRLSSSTISWSRRRPLSWSATVPSRRPSAYSRLALAAVQGSSSAPRSTSSAPRCRVPLTDGASRACSCPVTPASRPSSGEPLVGQRLVVAQAGVDQRLEQGAHIGAEPRRDPRGTTQPRRGPRAPARRRPRRRGPHHLRPARRRPTSSRAGTSSARRRRRRAPLGGVGSRSRSASTSCSRSASAPAGPARRTARPARRCPAPGGRCRPDPRW